MNIEITVKELNGRHIPAVTSQQVAAAFGICGTSERLWISVRNRLLHPTLD